MVCPPTADQPVGKPSSLTGQSLKSGVWVLGLLVTSQFLRSRQRAVELFYRITLRKDLPSQGL